MFVCIFVHNGKNDGDILISHGANLCLLNIIFT